jgi:hypothetical protein
VEATDGVSETGGATTRGAGDSTFVTVGLAVVVGDAGATGVTTVDCVTGGAGGSTACSVCGGASTLGAVGSVAGASCDGASVSSGAWTFGSGAETAVVMTWSVSGLANAGAIPPVSAAREITTPDARTATTLRLEQISSGAPMCASTPLTSRSVAFPPPLLPSQPAPPTLGLVQQLPRRLGCGNVAVAPSSTQKIHRWFGRTVTAGRRCAHP